MNEKVPQNVLVYGSNPVDWHAHKNGGGWVYKTSHVDATAYLHLTAIVYGNARVSGNARVYGDAWEFSPIYLQGSRHPLTLCSLTQIAIGCHVRKISYWLKRYKAIGRVEGYTPSQIAEYGKHIAYIAEYAETLQPKTKNPRKQKEVV